MSNQREPERLFESADAPPRLRSLLVRAHEDVPSAAERELLIKSAMGRGTGAWQSMPGPSGSVRWAARLARHSTKLLSMVAVVGVGAGAFYVSGVQHGRGGRSSPSTSAGLPAAAEAQQATRVAAAGEAPADVEGPGDRLIVAGEQPLAVAPRPVVAPGLRSHPRRRGALANATHERSVAANSNEPASIPPPRSSSPYSVAPVREDASAPEVAPAPAQDRPVDVAVARRGEPARPVGEHRVSDAGTAEATLLHAARQALVRSPEQTLSLTEEHLRLFPRGLLDQEREALAIEALIKLGRIDPARTRAHAFEQAYRDSPHRARIQRAFRHVPGGLAPP